MTSSSEEAAPEGANGQILAGRYYGRGIPYLPIRGYPGKLFVVEGTDGVGRSTQIQLLREWLEVKGYGVVETGWTRSPLMQPTIEIAKSSNTLNKLTFVLLYATDVADRSVSHPPAAPQRGAAQNFDWPASCPFAQSVQAEN